MTDLVLVIINVPELGPVALTPTALREARARARKLLGEPEAPPRPSSPTGPSLLDADALAEATGVPARWWMDQAREHRIPHARIGKRVRFCLAEVLACEAVVRRNVNGSSIRNGPASS